MSLACILVAVVACIVSVGLTLVIVSACAVSGSWAQAEEQSEQSQDVV